MTYQNRRETVNDMVIKGDGDRGSQENERSNIKDHCTYNSDSDEQFTCAPS